MAAVSNPDTANMPLEVDSPTTQNAAKPKRSSKKRRPNYGQIHSRPLPLEVFPLPAFTPSNPLSLLRLVYCYLSQYIWPPNSHSISDCIGHFSPETRSVHVTDPKHIRILWEMGFFGKGSLSRSEPSWITREQARLREESSRGGGGTAEEVTRARREERRMFKLERARLEREKIERQRAIEAGVELSARESGAAEAPVQENHGLFQGDQLHETATSALKDEKPVSIEPKKAEQDLHIVGEDLGTEIAKLEIEQQEHLQLTLEESFFLYYGLDVISIYAVNGDPASVITTASEAIDLFGRHATYPAHSKDISWRMQPDNPFLVNYVVYHHFRSLGWVVRSGVKFSVDFLLYNKGPVFSHAEFAIMIVPAYSHRYWSTEPGCSQRRVKEPVEWWWLHCVNRVQNQVRKTLVLVYVDIPPPTQTTESTMDVGKLLKSYKVREFVVRRWAANRSRD